MAISVWGFAVQSMGSASDPGSDGISGWSSGARGNCVGPYGALSVLLREENKLLRNNSNVGNSNPGRGRVRPESVMEAVTLVANGQAFEVVYYLRASTPEFCVKGEAVKAAMTHVMLRGFIRLCF